MTRLSVFGIGRELNEKQWRAVIRQLVAMGHLRADSEAFGALEADGERARRVERRDRGDAARGGRRLAQPRQPDQIKARRSRPADRRPKRRRRFRAAHRPPELALRDRTQARRAGLCRAARLDDRRHRERRARRRSQSSATSPASATRSSNITAMNCSRWCALEHDGFRLKRSGDEPLLPRPHFAGRGLG